MTREEANMIIDYLKEIQEDYIEGEVVKFPLTEWYVLDKAIQIIEQTTWTPVSEGLPKVADCYAVTKKIGSDLMTSACFFDRPNIWYNDKQRNLERNCLTNIVAWMPLPEPYKAENEDKG